MSRNADVSVLWLNAPFISARIRLSGERASVVTYTRVYASVAMHFTYFARLECRPFAPTDVIQPSVIPCKRGGRDVRDTRYVFTFWYRTEMLFDEHLYSSTVTCQTGRAKKGPPNKRGPLLRRRIFLYLFPTFSWMSLRFLRTWLREIGEYRVFSILSSTMFTNSRNSLR